MSSLHFVFRFFPAALLLAGAVPALASTDAGVSTSALAETSESSGSVAMDRPNAFSVELLGRGALYSINYDRSLSDAIALGVGFSSWGVKTFSYDASILIIPVYANFYFSPGPHRGFLTAGADFAAVEVTQRNLFSTEPEIGNFKGKGTGVAAIVGGGYELRSESGFLLRVTPYVLIGKSTVAAWAGVSLGAAF